MRSKALGPALIGAMLLLTLLVYGQLPERVPVHWNIRGETDGWANRWPGAFMTPVIGLGVWLLLRVLPKVDPRRANYERFEETYWLLANVILLFMVLVHVMTLGSALGWPVDMPRVMVSGVGLLFVVLGNYLPRVRSNWWMGIRTPWTLESERVWRSTHRLAGRTFVVGGLMTMAAAAALPRPAGFYIAFACIMAAALVPLIYSYLAWRREEREA